MKVQEDVPLQAFVQGMLDERQRRHLDIVRETLLENTSALDRQAAEEVRE